MKKKVEVALAGSMTLALASIVTLAPVASSPVKTALVGPQISDFALLDQELTVGDKSVQCGATSVSNTPSPTAFVMYITMTNRGDLGLGGASGFVRTTYHGGDFVDYAIPVNTTVQISLAGGGTPGEDDGIVVTAKSGAVLIGQVSIVAPSGGKPLPALSPSFCTTTKVGDPDFTF